MLSINTKNTDLVTDYKALAKVGNFWVIGQLADKYKVSRAKVYELLAQAERDGKLVESIFDE